MTPKTRYHGAVSSTTVFLVAFPALEELEIEELPNKQIWDDSAGEVENFFCNLQGLYVGCCDNMVNIISFSMRSRLHQLRKLSIYACNSVVSVVEEGIFPSAQAGAAIDLVLGLSELQLLGLMSLISTGLENVEYRGHCSNLTILKVVGCPILKNVVSSSIATNLVHLQELEIFNCEGIEEVVAMGKVGEEYQEAQYHLIVFSALKILHLKMLPNFRTFCRSRFKKEYAKDEEPLFNHEVVFPTLEKLMISGFPNKQIWDDSREVENSFCNLRVLDVELCGNLVNVIPSSIRPRLHQLKELSISECNSVVSVVEEGIFPSAQAEAAIELVLGLSDLNLKGLKSLKGTGLENVAYRGGCSNLTFLKVIQCPILKNVVSSHIATKLVRLQTLEISDCEDIEEVVAMEKAGEECQEAKNHLIVFSELNRLHLHMLQSFRTFCRSIPKKEYAKYEEPLFNHQVSLPELEECFVSGVNSNVIFGGCLPLHSFDKLKELEIVSCDNLSTVVPADLLPRLQNLQSFSVKQCSEVTEVFELEGLNVSEGQVKLLSKLECLSLSKLPKLHCVWNNKDPHMILCLQSLAEVEIDGCHVLRNLFSPSIAAALVRLRLLKVCSCKGMEEIVSNEEKDRVMTGEIALTELEDIVLDDLPNIKSFCSENYAFKLSSLRKLALSGCRNIQNFISGKVSMPKKDVIDGNGNQLRDLNEYARQQATEASQLWNSLHADADEDEDEDDFDDLE